jgi:Uma2 family endonuclease
MITGLPTDTFSPPTDQQTLVLPGRYNWQHFRTLQTWGGSTPGLKITYLDGIIELMTTGKPHERIKKLIAILIEAYCSELGIRFFPSGNATCEAEAKGASFDPDESYCFETDKDYPDLAIEVIFTSGGIDKLEKYRRFNISEVWFWQNNSLTIHTLSKSEDDNLTYITAEKSRWFPDLDVAVFSDCIRLEDAFDARQQFLNALKTNNP